MIGKYFYFQETENLLPNLLASKTLFPEMYTTNSNKLFN